MIYELSGTLIKAWYHDLTGILFLLCEPKIRMHPTIDVRSEVLRSVCVCVYTSLGEPVRGDALGKAALRAWETVCLNPSVAFEFCIRYKYLFKNLKQRVIFLNGSSLCANVE